MEKPFVSVCFTSYNQARFVELALQSVLHQSYPNMEVVICDDGSTDGTIEIIERTIETYRANGGVHPVSFHRAICNQGVVRNATRCFRLAKGELLIQAHDDDVSMLDRVEVIVRAWVAADKKPTIVLHGWKKIDMQGRVFGNEGPWGRPNEKDWQDRSFERMRSVWPLGAAAAYSPAVVTMFDDISVLDTFEDTVFAYRAFMIGCPLLIRDRLVYYRYDSGATTSTRKGVRTVQIAKKGERGGRAAIQTALDFKKIEGRFPVAWLAVARQVADCQYEERAQMLALFKSDGLIEKTKLLFSVKNYMVANVPKGRRYLIPVLIWPWAISEVLLGWLVAFYCWRSRTGERIVDWRNWSEANACRGIMS